MKNLQTRFMILALRFIGMKSSNPPLKYDCAKLQTDLLTYKVEKEKTITQLLDQHAEDTQAYADGLIENTRLNIKLEKAIKVIKKIDKSYKCYCAEQVEVCARCTAKYFLKENS